MANSALAELQKAAESIREGLKTVDEDIKKLTGRDPSQPFNRQQGGQRIQLKRNTFQKGEQGGPVAKAGRKDSNEGGGQRRWGRTVTSVASRISLEGSPKLDSSGEEESSSKPAIQSSVVATGKPAKIERNVLKEDKETKSRNKRMFGLLIGTLQRFKEDSKQTAARERKRKEIEKKLERKAEEEKEELEQQKRELFQARKSKQEELKKLERKMELAALKDEIAEHYNELQKYIKLKSSPSIFYLPAKHNEKTVQLLQDSREHLEEALNARYKEMDLSDDDDVEMELQPTRPIVKGKRSVTRRVVREVREVRDPGHRDLFEEDREDELMEEGEHREEADALEEGEIREYDVREIEVKNETEYEADYVHEYEAVNEGELEAGNEHELEAVNEPQYEMGNEEGHEAVNERTYEGDNEDEPKGDNELNSDLQASIEQSEIPNEEKDSIEENAEAEGNSYLAENYISYPAGESQTDVVENNVEQVQSSSVNGHEELQMDYSADANYTSFADPEGMNQESFSVASQQENGSFF